MPESTVVDQPTGSETTSTSNQQSTPPGWLAGLPADLRDNEAFKSHKTVGDFAKAHLDTAAKAKEYEVKLANSIPKLGENATPEERDKFFNSLGRPEKPEGYELEGGDKAKEEILKPWKADFHELGLTTTQAKGLKAKFDARLNKLTDDYKADIAKQIATTSATLKTELGDKYDASVELASRLWKQWGKTEVDFDKAFATETSANRVTMIRFLLNVAAKTGEDSSLKASGQRTAAPKSGYDLSKFNLPAAKV